MKARCKYQCSHCHLVCRKEGSCIMKTLVQVLEWQGGPAVWRSRESVPWPFCVLMMWFMILRHETSMERPELKKSEGIWHGTVCLSTAAPC